MQLTCFVALCTALATAEVLLPDDPRISYIGRFETQTLATGENVRAFAWPGSQIVVRFKGESISANLSGSDVGDNFHVTVDGKKAPQGGEPFTALGPDWGWYGLGEELDKDVEHEVVLWKTSEDNARNGSTARFAGFAASNWQEPVRRTRRLEFIGDGDTAGWCADGSNTTEGAYEHYENTYHTWATRIAKSVDAEMVVEAISGIGVKDWPIKQYLRNVLPFQNGTQWDPSSWVPDAVVMLIGHNDKVKASDPEEFIDAYRDLMEVVADIYKAASTPPKIIHVCGGSINGLDPCPAIQIASAQFNKGRTDGFQGYCTSITAESWRKINNNTRYHGCASHYNKEGHKILAGEILPQIQHILGWSETTFV